MFLGTVELLGPDLAKLVDTLGAFIMRETGITSSVSTGYANCILSTGTLMFIMPLLILYLFAQKGFVESLSSSGIKM